MHGDFRNSGAGSRATARWRAGLFGAAAAVAYAAILAPASMAQAQAAAPAAGATEQGVMDAIVVTAPKYVPHLSGSATKLQTPLIETPQSVTVINRDQIDLLNWQNLGQAVRYTAGIVGENYGSDERYDWLTLRGFNPVQFVDGLQAPVGSVSNTGLDLYGSQSVEILKGPASVLYGLAPPGGIVNMTSRRPEDKFGGSVQLLYGSYDNKQIAGDITGPVNDLLDLRLTSLYRDRDTQVDGVRSQRFYLAPAATVHITPNTDLTFLSYYQWDDVRGDGGGFFPAAGIYSANPVGRITSNVNLGDYNYNRFVHRQYGVGYDFKHDFNSNLTFEQNLKYFDSYGRMLDVYGAGLATTTTSGPGLYQYLNPLTGIQETDGSGDPLYSDYRTVNRNNFPFKEMITSFNVDSRLTDRFNTGPIEHTVLLGVDYRRYTLQSYFGFTAAPTIDLFAPNHNQAITTPAYYPYSNQVQDQIGVYAQDEAKLGRWVLTLTGRQDWVDAKNYGVPQDDQKFSYRAGLNYVFKSGLAPYISYATSFQPTTGSDFFGNPFKPTTGEQVEGGIKFEPHFVPRAVKILTTLAVYDLKQDNVLVTDPDTVNHPFAQVQAGHVEVKGVELEAVARIYERISLNASYSYTESDVTGTAGTPTTRLTLTPKNKLSVFADYTFQTGPLAGFGAGLGYRYISSTYGDTANQWLDPAYGLFDAVAHYDINKWRISVEASNLFDKVSIAQCSSEADCFYGLRRNVVATVTRRF
jgi:iron complex outermembrane receptor protein